MTKLSFLLILCLEVVNLHAALVDQSSVWLLKQNGGGISISRKNTLQNTVTLVGHLEYCAWVDIDDITLIYVRELNLYKRFELFQW